MKIQSPNNLYPGVNLHLTSLLQSESGGWESFHSDFITFIREELDRQLPSGYLARSEKSLQISEIFQPSPRETRTKPDVTIYGPSSPVGKGSMIAAAEPTAIYSIEDTLEEEENLVGIIIYQAGEGSLLGRPITRLEVLSAANKPGGSHYPKYLTRWQETLQSGLRLIEIDLLHESRPVLRLLPSYRDDEAGAYPYLILVSDPRPTFKQGPTKVYGFEVDDDFPLIEIPLAGADSIVFDFGAVYNRVFEGSRFCYTAVDYAIDPINFDHYTEADREKIQARLSVIREAHGG